MAEPGGEEILAHQLAQSQLGGQIMPTKLLLAQHIFRIFFKSTMCYDHNKYRFQYYVGLLSKPLNNYSSQKKPELNQTEKQNIRSFLY